MSQWAQTLDLSDAFTFIGGRDGVIGLWLVKIGDQERHFSHQETKHNTHTKLHHGPSNLSPVQTHLHHPHLLQRVLLLPLRQGSLQFLSSTVVVLFVWKYNPVVPPPALDRRHGEQRRRRSSRKHHHLFLFLDYIQLFQISTLLSTCTCTFVLTRVSLLSVP